MYAGGDGSWSLLVVFGSLLGGIESHPMLMSIDSDRMLMVVGGVV